MWKIEHSTLSMHPAETRKEDCRSGPGDQLVKLHSIPNYFLVWRVMDLKPPSCLKETWRCWAGSQVMCPFSRQVRPRLPSKEQQKALNSITLLIFDLRDDYWDDPKATRWIWPIRGYCPPQFRRNRPLIHHCTVDAVIPDPSTSSWCAGSASLLNKDAR